MKIVTVNGCFDVLHAGHVDLLEFAKSQGDHLIVLLNSDKSVKILKGQNRPISKQEDRLRVLSALRCVNEVWIFNELTPLIYLQLIKPAVHVKSKGAIKEKVAEERKVVEKYGGKVIWFEPKKCLSTTKIIKRMK
jgi:rfaE bifunctional protein nucleotidyltransferase chain/domain